MLELSRTRVLLARTAIVRLEIEAMLDVVRAETTPGQPIPLLGDNALWAFGERGGFKIVGHDGEDGSAAVREAMGRAVRGPGCPTAYEDGVPAGSGSRGHRAAGAAGTGAGCPAGRARWRVGRLRDVVAARETALEWIDAITQALRACDITFAESVGEDRDTMRWFANEMPSSRVAVTLKTRYHRDGRHRWTPNDINDIDALATAVADCDAVFVDKGGMDRAEGLIGDQAARHGPATSSA